MKKKKSKYKLSDPAPISRKTRKAILALEDRYDSGSQAIAETRTKSGKAKYRAAAVSNLARKEGASKSFVYDSRQFASSYTREEFDELIKLAEKHNAQLGPSHVVELLRLDDPKQRARVQTKAAENHWSVERLKKEVRKLKAN